MHSITIGLVVPPLSCVRVFIVALPNSESMLLRLDPLAIVHLPILPEVNSFPVGLVVYECSFIDVAIFVNFIPLSVSLVVLPLALIDSSAVVSLNSKPMPLLSLFIYLTPVSCILVPFHAKILLIH